MRVNTHDPVTIVLPPAAGNVGAEIVVKEIAGEEEAIKIIPPEQRPAGRAGRVRSHHLPALERRRDVDCALRGGQRGTKTRRGPNPARRRSGRRILPRRRPESQRPMRSARAIGVHGQASLCHSSPTRRRASRRLPPPSKHFKYTSDTRRNIHKKHYSRCNYCIGHVQHHPRLHTRIRIPFRTAYSQQYRTSTDSKQPPLGLGKLATRAQYHRTHSGVEAICVSG